ncbi:MAG: response regulator, partial [Moraxellaceae bacterium]|nr:response regulator [Pseudobdellovibrionaceae bacterium]
MDQINVLSNLSGLSILVVDDCEDNQFLLSHLLKRKGAMISTASNGQEAVEKALTEKFDVILMDIQMPYMDGFEAQKQIKAAGVPV